MKIQHVILILAIAGGVIYYFYGCGEKEPPELKTLRSDASQSASDAISSASKRPGGSSSSSSAKTEETPSSPVSAAVLSFVSQTEASDVKVKSRREMLEECRSDLETLSSKKNKDPKDYERLLNAAVTGDKELSPVVRAYVFMAAVIIESDELCAAAKAGVTQEGLEKMAKEWTPVCSKCSSTGLVVCPVCRGKKSITKKVASGLEKGGGKFKFDNEMSKTVTVSCEKCGGQGKIACSACNAGKPVLNPSKKLCMKNIGSAKKKALAMLDKAIASEQQ